MMKKGLILAAVLGIGILGACTNQETGKGVNEEKPKVEQVKKEAEKKKSEEQTQKESKYATEVTNILLNSYKTDIAIYQKFEEVKKNPLLMLDDDWKQSLRDAYEPLSEDYGQLKNMEVPERFKTAHEKLLQGFEYTLQSKDKMLEGIDTMNPDLLREGLELLEKSNALLEEAKNEMKSLAEENLRQVN